MSFAGLPNGYSHLFHHVASNGSASNPHRHPGSSNISAVSPSALPSDDPAHAPPGTGGMLNDPTFDIFDWHPAYNSCIRYFLDHAQHDGTVQAVAALVNIALPFQWAAAPALNAADAGHHPGPGGVGGGGGPGGGGGYNGGAPPVLGWGRGGPALAGRGGAGGTSWVSLVPYVRRLVVTGFDRDGVLHGFFGDEWRKGVGPIQECERRNYLFAAKSVGWAKVKALYDMTPHESVPFLAPLREVCIEEIEGAEKNWSAWLAMEDWMVGPRAPETMGQGERGEGTQRGREG